MSEKNKLAASLGMFLRMLCDLMVLNLLWILCSIPIFTIGPATSALCRTSLKLVRDESSSLPRDFFAAFRRDFGKAVVLGLLGVLGIMIAVSDLLYAASLSGGIRVLFLIVGVLVSAIVLCYLTYAFVLHACFENSISGYIRNALSLAIASPVDTLQIWIFFAIPILTFLLLPEIAVIYIGFLYILFSVSTPAFFAAKRQAGVIARFDGGAQVPHSQSGN